MVTKPQLQRRASSVAISIYVLLTGCQSSQYVFHGSPYTTPESAPIFQLTHTEGNPLSFPADVPGISLIFFGYTYCPDVCPATAAQMKWVFDQLKEKEKNVNFIFVSVDPQRDSLQVIEDFLVRFNPSFIGLRGDEEELEPIKQAYGVYAEVDSGSSGDDYLITHTARVFLVDNEGILRTSYPFDTPREDILSDIEYLLGKIP